MSLLSLKHFVKVGLEHALLIYLVFKHIYLAFRFMSAEADQLYLLPGVSQKYRKLIKCFTNKRLRVAKNF